MSNESVMHRESKIFVAGGTGMVGTALISRLLASGYNNIIASYHNRQPSLTLDSNLTYFKLDLTRQTDVETFFEKERPELLGYIRGKLHNHDITIDVKVNETLVLKKSYTAQDKYNRLVELNPNLEMMRNLFGLEVNE